MSSGFHGHFANSQAQREAAKTQLIHGFGKTMILNASGPAHCCPHPESDYESDRPPIFSLCRRGRLDRLRPARTTRHVRLFRKIARRTAVNKMRRTRVRSAMRKVEEALARGDSPAAVTALKKAARESDLPNMAEDNTRDFLTALAKRLGYEQVEIKFEDASAP